MAIDFNKFFELNFGRRSRDTFRRQAEDVEYKEIDPKARKEQIADAAAKDSEEIIEKDPIIGLLRSFVWMAGAEWGDKNPKGGYGSRFEWQKAGRAHCEKLLDERNRVTQLDRDLTLDCLLTAVFLNGMTWADKNPAPVK